MKKSLLLFLVLLLIGFLALTNGQAQTEPASIVHPPDCCSTNQYTIHLMPPKWDDHGDIINLGCYSNYLTKFDQVKLDFLNNVHANCPKCPTDPLKHDCSCIDWYYHLAVLDNTYYYQLHYLNCIAEQ